MTSVQSCTKRVAVRKLEIHVGDLRWPQAGAEFEQKWLFCSTGHSNSPQHWYDAWIARFGIMASDITTELSWQESDMERSLATLSRHVQDRARANIQWYYAKKGTMARTSYLLRLVTIVFITMGALAPIVKATIPGVTPLAHVDVAQLGYFFLAFAGACVAADRYLGYSNAWIRFIITAFSIEKELEDFRLDWVRSSASWRGKSPTSDQLNEMIELCKAFNSKVTQLIQAETAQWVTESKTVTAELQKVRSQNSAG